MIQNTSRLFDHIINNHYYSQNKLSSGDRRPKTVVINIQPLKWYEYSNIKHVTHITERDYPLS
jgi:hypothetical protein